MNFSVGERVPALRAFADLGYHKAKAAKLLGVTRNTVGRLCDANGIEMRVKSPPRDITLRRVAAMREMADLGCTATQIAILLRIDKARVSQLKKSFGIEMQRGRAIKPDWLRRLILRDFGKPGVTNSVMAERYSVSQGSISVTIHRLRKEGKLPPVQQRCLQSL